MNDNPGGTPNPLANSSDTGADASKKAKQTETPAVTVPVESMDPTGRPMEQNVPAPEPPKKSKTGLIVGLIIGAVLLIGGGIAAAILLTGGGGGYSVDLAMQKLMSGQIPSDVVVDGDIDIALDSDEIPFKHVNIALKSSLILGTMTNDSLAKLTFTDEKNKDYSFEIEEIYAPDEDLYLKVEGATAAIEDSGILEQINGVDSIISIIEAVDGVYFRVSSDEMKSLIEETGADTEQLSCVKNLVSDFGKNSSTTAQLYNKYPFVTSTNENVTVASKQNPIYELGLDSENFTNYFNEVQNTEIATSLYDCLDVKKSEDLSENDVAAMVKKLPKIYAEVNSANNFTRLYTTSDINGMATVTVDFGFSYPSSVNVSEPSEYKNLIDFIQDLANNTSSSSSSKKK